MIRLAGQNFILRDPLPEDAPSIQKHINNKKIHDNTTFIPHPYSVRDAENWLASVEKDRAETSPSKLSLMIELDGEACGCVAYNHIKPGHQANIGYWLSEQYWNRGIMTEAVGLFTTYGFEALKLRRIYTKVVEYNPTSARVLEKNGYRQEGRTRQSASKNGQYFDHLLYGKLATDR